MSKGKAVSTVKAAVGSSGTESEMLFLYPTQLWLPVYRRHLLPLDPFPDALLQLGLVPGLGMMNLFTAEPHKASLNVGGDQCECDTDAPTSYSISIFCLLPTFAPPFPLGCNLYHLLLCVVAASGRFRRRR